MEYSNLSALQLDALKEVSNIGAGNAATDGQVGEGAAGPDGSSETPVKGSPLDALPEMRSETGHGNLRLCGD